MNRPPTLPNRRLYVVGVVLLATVVVAAVAIPWRHRNALVVYCAHDAIYSQKLLREFEDQTGVDVVIRFDTEGTKALGLVNLIRREHRNPRCDVFWNNQLLGTLDLLQEDLLIAYKGPGYERIPDRYKDPEGRWAGFGGRLRVYIVNTDRMSAHPEHVHRAGRESPERMAMAKPLYGTTRTHYTVLWHQWGGEQLARWHRQLRQQGILETQGNSTVKNMVAAGKRDLGWTDTDDFFVALDDGFPVEMLPIRTEDGQTICIPNTVAIIKGTEKLADAQRLVDFLLSEQTELALAHSKSRQIPLGTVDQAALPRDVKRLTAWAQDAFPLGSLGASRVECLSWLKSEYAP